MRTPTSESAGDLSGSEGMTVLEEMGLVMRSVPGPRASVEDVARWYERKAHLLEHIAADGAADVRGTLRQADAAHRRAMDLLATRSR